MPDRVRHTVSRAILGSSSPAKSLSLIVAGSLILTLSAKVQVPFHPVPMTMQTLVVLLLGMVYGPKLAGATLLAYLAQGAAGLPVFAGTPEKGMGLAYMAGPTGGYLLGFLIAAVLVGHLAERGWDRTPLKLAATGFLGLAAIYAPGLFWLGTAVGWGGELLEFGLWPFLPSEVLKLALLVGIVHVGAWRLRR